MTGSVKIDTGEWSEPVDLNADNRGYQRLAEEVTKIAKAEPPVLELPEDVFARADAEASKPKRRKKASG